MSLETHLVGAGGSGIFANQFLIGIEKKVKNMFFAKDTRKFSDTTFLKNLCVSASRRFSKIKSAKGFSLIELIITISILAVLTLTTAPLVQNAVRRDKEQRLRETLRQIRAAIDEFKRDTVGGCQQGNIVSGNPIEQQSRGGGFGQVSGDPRSRVVIADCKIFEVENLDRYPPSLETLVDGVSVKPRGVPPGAQSGGGVFDGKNATDIASSETKETKKRYLREIPIDPITGKNDTWILRSSYQEKEDETWDEVNLFDIRSGAEGEALNEQKYKEF